MARVGLPDPPHDPLEARIVPDVVQIRVPFQPARIPEAHRNGLLEARDGSIHSPGHGEEARGVVADARVIGVQGERTIWGVGSLRLALA